MTHASPPAPLPKVIEGLTGPWEIVIGLEVHAQVASRAKLFSGAATDVGAEPNRQVSFVDAGMPGMLPVLNEGCVAMAVRTGLGLKAAINLVSAFDRKNYFYPDLPQGYQISQLFAPLVGAGEVLVDLPATGRDGPTRRRVRIERIHLEQDAGKSIHDMDPQLTFVDLNRTGVALMEIVSRPDIRSPEEAAAYVAKLRQIMRYLGTCDGDMQHGNLRADVNVSVCRPGDVEAGRLGTRCEIKNMNSLRFIQAAIEHEARRQIAVLEDGGAVVQETRLYDPARDETRSMRSKEEAHDYRYFPDPDLLPLEIDQAWVDELGAALPELPDAKMARFVESFGLSIYDASVLTSDVARADYFEGVLDAIDASSTWTVRRQPDQKGNLISAKGPADWVINGLLGRLKSDGDRPIEDSPIAPGQLAAILLLIEDGVISSKIAKDLFEIVYVEGEDPGAIVEARGLRQVTDEGAIEAAVDRVIAANPAQVEKARANPKLAGWFVGQVMAATGGKAAPATVNALVKARLGL